jgi:hypothetical protein
VLGRSQPEVYKLERIAGVSESRGPGTRAFRVDYARRGLRPQTLEGGVELDPMTQLPKGFKGKIDFSEPSREAADPELNSVDRLLELANTALLAARFNCWVLLDRLDVAFAEDLDLENNALRALFRVYLDLLALSNVKLKIFLRTDIWNRITTQGFREASHITRHMTISWNRSSLLNPVVRRALYNPAIRKAYLVKDGAELHMGASTNVSVRRERRDARRVLL